MTPQQYKRLIDEYNRKVNQYNRDVKKNYDENKRRIDNYNREVNKVNAENNRRTENYNRQVRQFNSKQKQNLERAIQTFKKSSFTIQDTRVISFRTSVQNLENRYLLLDDYNIQNNVHDSRLLIDYPVQETNNSIQLYNSLASSDQGDYLDPTSLQHTEIEERLYRINPELGKRWKGAIYSLNPNNPDASRHFCTSVREIFMQVLNTKAPDDQVLRVIPDCKLHQGKPARREKIRYLLMTQPIKSEPLADFVEADIDDLITLFGNLNQGTHGNSGTFNVQQLLKIKKRAEDGILFISELCEG